jgi:hypothetical protein
MTRQPQKLDLSCTSDEFKVAVRGYGVKVEIDPDGNVTVYSHRSVKMLPPEAAANTSTEALKIGAKMPDGSVYVGVSPDTGKKMYATPKDGSLTCTFNEAGEYAAKLEAHGHKDWRVPSKAELDVLFQHRAAIGGFDTTGSDPAGWYWSSSRYDYYSAWAQRFSDGSQDLNFSNGQSALRCVRG